MPGIAAARRRDCGSLRMGAVAGKPPCRMPGCGAGEVGGEPARKEKPVSTRWLVGLLLAASLLTVGVGALGAAPAGAGASYAASLSGGEEVPPRTTPASGQATFQVSAD